jgi:hypothetical protein
MRLMLPVVVGLLGGCQSETELRFMSTLPAQTRGVVMSEDGIESYVAMRGTTCTITTTWGCPTVDTDLPTEQERIVDHHAGRTLAQSAVGVHHLTGSAWDAADDLIVSDVIAARLSNHGALVIHGDAERCHLLADDAEVDVDVAVCAGNTRAVVDREGDALWVATGEAVYRVSPESTRRFSGTDDLIAYDGVHRASYLAVAGSRKLRAIDDLGRELWSVPTRTTITAVATRGGRGDVLVLGHHGKLGLLERRDGATGELLASYDLPGGDGELVVSANGVGLAIQHADEVHYYVLEIAGEPAVIDEEPVVCLDLRDRMSMD